MLLTNTFTAAVLLSLAATSQAQGVENVTPDQARANFARPVALAPDDVRAFPEPPAAFADPQAGVAAGRIEEFSYDSGDTVTQRQAMV